MQFELLKTAENSKARRGRLTTDHGTIETPVFMPVGTVGTVKGVPFEYLHDVVNAEIILGNTYHLYLRPGIKIIKDTGGLQKFIGWNKPMLTDSGGYQVFSLSAQRKLTEEGAHFQSHIDGSRHMFTPENIIDIQREIGADIIMAFDECTPYPCAYDYAENSMHLTHRWLARCIEQFHKTKQVYDHEQALFPIIQGSVYEDLRIQSAQEVIKYPSIGYAIGGLSVGEPKEEMYAMTEVVTQILPTTSARYLMGVGTPANIIESISRGIDMFDCVMPTRNARHGMLYTMNGILNIKNQKWVNDYSAIDETSLSPMSRHHSKAYLRHLIKGQELLGMQMASIHNLAFYAQLTDIARSKIEEGTFATWKTEIVNKLDQRR